MLITESPPALLITLTFCFLTYKCFCLEINTIMMNECTGYWLDNHVLSEPPTCKTILPKFISPRADGAGTNSPRLFTPGETKALAKSKVHQ
jgi:hypothetical protein